MFFEVYPNSGHLVRRPDSGAIIPPNGDIVPRDDESFWRRRELDGAVRLVERESFPETLDQYPEPMRNALLGVDAEPEPAAENEAETPRRRLSRSQEG